MVFIVLDLDKTTRVLRVLCRFLVVTVSILTTPGLILDLGKTSDHGRCSGGQGMSMSTSLWRNS